jgi:arylsulfatase
MTLNDHQHVTGGTIMQRVSTFFASFALGFSLLATLGCEGMSADKKPADRSSDAAESSMSPAKAATKDTASVAAPAEATAKPAAPVLSAESAAAPATYGEAGSPSATATINGKQLPPPDPEFGGVIRDAALQSKAWWAPRVVPPKGAPNVLLIMTDDVGFGAPSTFGGVIPTPALDRVAKAGLRYTCFHSTALCSPTRAALITGRNHHSAGFGVVSEQATGFPGYNSIIAKDKATIGRILKDNGYATSWFGKNHNTPTFQASQAGPFDQWPTGMGFEYFYGFIGGDTSQWQPRSIG